MPNCYINGQMVPSTLFGFENGYCAAVSAHDINCSSVVILPMELYLKEDWSAIEQYVADDERQRGLKHVTDDEVIQALNEARNRPVIGFAKHNAEIVNEMLKGLKK